jgi:hypothetical protein
LTISSVTDPELNLPCAEPTFLFIGGAPRSGTTLLASLLDGHPATLLFPAEHSTLERFFWNRHRIESYARDEFVNQRSEGQQTLLSNRDFFERKRHLLNEEFGKQADLDLDFSRFKASFLDYLQNRKITLQSMLGGLSFAQICANPYSHQHAGPQTKFLVFKQPFFTETFAQQVARELPNCKFIHILRDPISRYVSAKTRRLKQAQLNGRRLSHINRLSYVAGHTIIDLATRELAASNVDALGESKYRLIEFADLVRSPAKTIASVLDWLSLSSDGFPISPTRMGQPIDSGSTLSTGYQVDSTSLERNDKYLSITSPGERRIHAWLLQGLLKNQVKKSRLQVVPDLLIPLPKSSWKNYLCQLGDLGRSLVAGCPVSVESFIESVRRGKAHISGAT